MALRYRHRIRSSSLLSACAFIVILFVSTLATVPAHGQEVIVRDNMIIAPAPAAESICSFDAMDIDTHFYLRYEDVYPGREADEESPAARSLEPVRQTQPAQFQVTYLDDCNGESWPQAAMDAFDRAAEIWSTHVTSDVPVRIEANWTSFDEEQTLASASPTRIVRFQGSSPEVQADTWYPVAMASAITGQDIVGDQIEGEDFDIVVNMGCERNDWHFGIAQDPPSGTIDFLSVVLHEIGHGLGFIGAVRGDEDAEDAEWGIPPTEGGSPLPIIFDRFVETGDGISILDEEEYPNPSETLYEAVTGQRGGVFFEGVVAGASDPEGMAELYAPRPWNPGSSYSHLDQDKYTENQQPTENGLMRPRIAHAERVASPGPVFCGMLYDMGWPIGDDCLQILDLGPIFVLNLSASIEGGGNGRAVQLSWDADGLTREFIVERCERMPGAPADVVDQCLAGPQNNPSVSDRYVPVDTLSGRSRQVDFDSVNPGRYAYRIRQVGALETGDIGPNCPYPVEPNQCLSEAQEIVIDPDGEVFIAGPYPNPFQAAAQLSFVVESPQHVMVDVYDVSGRRVATLFNEEAQDQTSYPLLLQDVSLPSGTYFFYFVGETFTETRTATLVR